MLRRKQNPESSKPPADPGELTPRNARRLADHYLAQGFDCAETLVRVFERFGLMENMDTNTLLTLASGFGKGIGKTYADCGALSGSILVINAIFVPERKTGKRMYKITGEFSKRFIKEFGSVNCAELRIVSKDCEERTRRTAEILAQFLLEKRGRHQSRGPRDAGG